MEKIYSSLFFRHSNLALILFIIALTFFAFNTKDFQLDASADSLILEQDEDLKKFRKVINDYGSNDFLIVTFTDREKIITEINLKKIKSFINDAIKFNWIESIQSIFDIPLLEVNNQNLTDLIN